MAPERRAGGGGRRDRDRPWRLPLLHVALLCCVGVGIVRHVGAWLATAKPGDDAEGAAPSALAAVVLQREGRVADDGCCAEGAWWAAAGVFDCGCRVGRRSPDATTLRVYMSGDGVASGENDAVVVEIGGAGSVGLRARDGATRAEVWNGLAVAARAAGYARLVVGAVGGADALAATLDGGAALAVAAVPGAAADGARFRVAACGFGIDLAALGRFAPRHAQLFDDRDAPADALVTRMLAARVDPVVVFGDCPEAKIFADVARPPPPRVGAIAALAVKKREEMERTAWPKHANTAIFGCDFPKNHIETPRAWECKNRCLRLEKCKAFSYLTEGGVCFLKTCKDHRYTLAAVDTYVKSPGANARRAECPDRSSTTVDLYLGADGNRRVAILVTVHGALEYALRCVRAIFANTDAGAFGLYLVNDRSSEATRDALAAAVAGRPDVFLVNWAGTGDLRGYTRATNAGLRAALGDDAGVAAPRSPYDAFCLLNSDAEVASPTWLRALTAAAFSSEEIGAVGPLSNAASYQSVPNLKAGGDWATNPLPANWTAGDVSRGIARVSRRTLVDVPVLNGFCLYVKASTFRAVGLFDDVAFPFGFGEENDFALRTVALGYALKVVDSVYVFHHKSKSYGDASRRELAAASREVMERRWGTVLKEAIGALERNAELGAIRRRAAENLGERACRPGSLRVLFVLNPIRRAPTPPAMHGGWISIVNQALGLRKRGVCARVAVSAWTVETFEANFPDSDGAFLPYADAARTPDALARMLFDHAALYDVFVATLFTTVEAVAAVAACHPNLATAYFVQDYEVDFDNLSDALREKAFASYTLVEDMVLFAKTAWLRRKVEGNHNVTVHAVSGSVDLSAFDGALFPRSFSLSKPLTLSLLQARARRATRRGRRRPAPSSALSPCCGPRLRAATRTAHSPCWTPSEGTGAGASRSIRSAARRRSSTPSLRHGTCRAASGPRSDTTASLRARPSPTSSRRRTSSST